MTSKLFAISLAAFISTATAQDGGSAPPKIERPLPFRSGEVLTYEVSFSKLIFSGTIGQLKLTVSDQPSSTDSGPEHIEFRAEATSKGFFTRLFGLKVNDLYKSIVSGDDLGLLSSTVITERGKLRYEYKTVIDRQLGRVTYSERDLTKGSGPKIKQADSPKWVHDALSAIYFARTLPLKEGSSFTIPISGEGRVYHIEVVVKDREQIAANSVNFRAVRLEAKIFDGRFIRRSGQMMVWLSDDARRIPLKAKIKTGGATITVELVGAA
jgi:hypothetical protein